MTHDHEHNHSHDYHHAPGDFVGAKPILNVANVAASLAYYVERLGFELVFAWCDETGFDSPRVPTFGEVRRGHAAIMLAQAAQGGPGMWIYLDVATAEELDGLQADYTRRGALIIQAPEDRPWNQREMLVQDLDGHVLRLGAPRA
jgi:uncharacterized glyoxalase superfamily protein PhnB